MNMKLLGIVLLGLVLLSLFIALRALTTGKPSIQMLRALTLRVLLSVCLFILIMASHYPGA